MIDALNIIAIWIGTVAFAVSGAMLGIRKSMDIFGVCMLGLTTAVGGGILRDVTLGLTPPAIFYQPEYIAVAIAASVATFIPVLRKKLSVGSAAFEKTLLIADSLGLGIFTVCGIQSALAAGFYNNPLLLVFVGVLTGVGGGVLRDVMSGERPYIFVKHIYACASIVGALLCILLRKCTGLHTAMLIGCAAIIAIRLFSARYRWNLPRA